MMELSKPTSWVYAWIGFNLLLQALDLATTVYGLHLGAHEAHPFGVWTLNQFGIKAIWGEKLLAALIITVFGLRYADRLDKFPLIVAAIFVPLVYTIVVSNNIIQLVLKIVGR